jgi:capsid protein
MTAAIWTAAKPIFFTMEFPSAMEVVPDFIKSAMARAEEAAGQEGADGGNSYGFNSGNRLNNMQPGTAETLPFGIKPVQMDAKFPTESAVGFTKDNLRATGSGSQVPYFMVANDLEGVNFSSGRLGLDAWHDTCERLQSHMIVNYRYPHFKEWLYAAIMSGEVKQPMNRYEELCDAAMFYGRRWDYIQPVQDAQADILRLESRLVSPSQICRERGGNFSKTCQEWKTDVKIAKAHGIDITGDVSLPTIKKGAPNTPEPSPDDPTAGEPPPVKTGKKHYSIEPKGEVTCAECGTRALNGESNCRQCNALLDEEFTLHVTRR